MPKRLRSIFIMMLSCILVLTNALPTFAAGGTDVGSGGSSTSTGGGGGVCQWGTEPRSKDMSGVKLTILLSPKDSTQSDPEYIYKYRSGYYATKTPISGPPGYSGTPTDVGGSYPIYFLATEGCLMEGQPNGDTYGTVTRKSISDYVVRSAGAFTSDAETIALINKAKSALSIDWWGSPGSIVDDLGLSPVTDDLADDVKEARRESNSKMFKALGAIWYKLYPNEITKSIMETGYYEDDYKEAIILVEPIVTLQPFGKCGTEKYGITISNFLNMYLYTRSSDADITQMADISFAFDLARKSPLYDLFRSQPVPYEGHNNIIGTIISKGSTYSGKATNGGDSIASKIYYTGPLTNGADTSSASQDTNANADRNTNKHGYGMLRNLDWVGDTSLTVFYGVGNLQGESGGTCVYTDSAGGTSSITKSLRSATKARLAGPATEVLATLYGKARMDAGFDLSLHINSTISGIMAVESGSSTAGPQSRQMYPTASQLSGSGTKVDNTEVLMGSDEKANSVVISEDLAKLYSDSKQVAPVTLGFMSLDVGTSAAPVQQYVNALSYIFNQQMINLQEEITSDLQSANLDSDTSGKYFRVTTDNALAYGSGSMGNFKAIFMKHENIRNYVAKSFNELVRDNSAVISNYPNMPNATVGTLLNGQGSNITTKPEVGIPLNYSIDKEIQWSVDLVSSMAYTQEDISNLILQGTSSSVAGMLYNRRDISSKFPGQEKVYGATELGYAIVDEGTPIELAFVRIENGVPVIMNAGTSGQRLPLGNVSVTGVARELILPTEISGNDGTEYRLSNVAVKSPTTDMNTFLADLSTAIKNNATSINTNGFEVPVVKVNDTAKTRTIKVSARPEDATAGSPITIVAVLSTDSGTTVVETYTNSDGTHVKTEINTIAVDDVLEITDKPAESATVDRWFTSTVEPIGISTDTPWSTINQSPRTGTTGSQVGNGSTTLDLTKLASPKVVYINYTIEQETISGSGSSDARYISFQQTLTDLKLNPYFLEEGTNTGYTINDAPFGVHIVKYPYSACDCVCTGHTYWCDGCESYESTWRDSEGNEHTDTEYYCSGHTVYYHGACEKCCKGHPCVFSSWEDPDYNVKVEDTNEHDKTFIADKNLDLYQFVYSKNFQAGSLSTLPTIGEIKLQIVAHRGNDKVTIAKYKPLGSGSSDLSQLGYKTNNFPTPAQRKTSSYKESSEFKWKEVGTDLDIAAICNGGHVHRGKMWAKKDTGFEINIDVYRDKENKGIAKATKLNPTSITVVNQEIQNVAGVAVSGDVIEFYPYVEMLYETSSKQNIPVYVLSDEKSYYQVNDYAEIGWTKPTENNLAIQSNQFSTHKAATNGNQWRQKNQVLPGGAIFGVTNANGAYTKVGLVTYQTYIPSTVLNAPGNSGTLGKDYNLNNLKASDALTVHNRMLRNLKAQLQTIGLEMMVNKNWNGGLTESEGAVIAKKGATLNLDYSRTLSTDNKYWFQERSGSAKNTDKNFDVREVGNKTTYYKVQAEPTKYDNSMKGDIVVSKSANGMQWTELARWSKDKTKTQIINSLSAELKVVNDRTLFITNFVDSVSRTSSWYSEAWDGICVIKQENLLEFGLMNPATRLSVLDPKLTPKQENLSDMWSKAFALGFRTENKTISVSFKDGASVTIKDVSKMSTSNKIYIPNATVSDVDR